MSREAADGGSEQAEAPRARVGYTGGRRVGRGAGGRGGGHGPRKQLPEPGDPPHGSQGPPSRPGGCPHRGPENQSSGCRYPASFRSRGGQAELSPAPRFCARAASHLGPGCCAVLLGSRGGCPRSTARPCPADNILASLGALGAGEDQHGHVPRCRKGPRRAWDRVQGQVPARFKPRVVRSPAPGPRRSPSTALCLSLLLCKVDPTAAPS